jgi:hypothetical protein
MQSLQQLAREVIREDAIRNPTYDTLNDYQRHKLIEAALEYRTVKLVNSIVIREINEALDEAILSLAVKRQFPDDDYEIERMLAEDIGQRSCDMNLAIQRNY